MEDELVKNLILKEMIAVPSHTDIYDITTSTPQEIVNYASAQKLLAVLVINQVAVDGSNNIVQNPRRISPSHPTLQAFYKHTKSLTGTDFSENQEVFAEVNMFILDEREAKHFWSGTSWSFQADGKGRAIGDISDMIANQLDMLKNRYR